MPEGYCVKCKAKKEIAEAVEETMKNGRKAIKGKCPTCGVVMFKILGGKAARSRNRRAATTLPANTPQPDPISRVEFYGATTGLRHHHPLHAPQIPHRRHSGAAHHAHRPGIGGGAHVRAQRRTGAASIPTLIVSAADPARPPHPGIDPRLHPAQSGAGPQNQAPRAAS